jgi:hypothetical protein
MIMDYDHRRALRLFATLALLSTQLFSQPLAAQDVATAETLFREGRELMKAGNLSAACEKFAASQKLDGSSGTLLNLADCHYKEGKVATAWGEFLAASRLARSQGNPGRSEEASKRAADLERSLSYLWLSFAAQVPAMEVKRDNQVLDAAVVSSKIPTDPGPHVISVSAPGYLLWTQTVIVSPGDVKTIQVPALTRGTSPTSTTSAALLASSAPPPSQANTAPAPSDHAGMRTAGFVVGGVGIAALAVGGIFGLRAGSTYKTADDACPTHVGCSTDALDKRSSAGTDATIADIGMGVGVVGLGVGVTLLILAGSKSQETTSWAVAPHVSSNDAGATLAGTF